MADKHKLYERNLSRIQENIEKYSPHPQKVRLVAVSKEVSPRDVRLLYELGVRDFGESRVQEFIHKIKELSDLQDICWHFIGHLQTNKIRNITGNILLLHSLDRLHLAEKLKNRLSKNSRKLSCLIQVNLAREEQKYGVLPEEIAGFLMILKGFQSINLKGLMTMAPLTSDMNLCYEVFSRAHELFSLLKLELAQPDSFDTLSMGMSNDYIPALKAGSTMLRIGSSIFTEDVKNH